MKKQLLVIVLVILTVYSVNAQYNEYSNKLKFKSVKELSINCFSNNFNNFVKNIDKFSNLKSLIIVNYEDKYLPSEIKTLNLKEITISNSPDLDYASTFKLFSKIATLKTIILDNNDIKYFPKEIKLVKNLNRLDIINNEGIEIENFVNTVKAIKTLKELNLSINLLTNLPKNIGELSQIEKLNISCNNLNDFPKSVKEIKGLDSLQMEDNMFTDQIKSLNKLKDIDLKFISLDTIVLPENRTIIKTMFPNATIKELNAITIAKDVEIYNIPKAENETNTKFGKITVNGVQFKAYSNAYYHYAKLFNNRRFDYTYDTLMFSERYMDTTYAGTMKIQADAKYNMLKIYKYKWFLSKDIKFDIVDRKYSMYFYKQYPELRAFNSITWVYKGNLSKKEFKKAYIKDKEWIDVRVYFNEEAKDFTIELKSRSSFTEIQAYPLFLSRLKYDNCLVESQKQYVKLNSRYSKGLDLKQRKFHKTLYRNKNKYQRTRKKAIYRTWLAFKKQYMSSEERKLTREEWLLYYDNIIANEKKALASASANTNVLTRSLDIEKYIYNNITSMADRGYSTVNAGFYNNKGDKLAVQSFIVIDLEDRSYYKFKSNLGIDLQSMFLANNNIAIVAELRNGDIGYITSSELSKLNIISGNEYQIKLNIIDKSLCTIGQLYSILGL